MTEIDEDRRQQRYLAHRSCGVENDRCLWRRMNYCTLLGLAKKSVTLRRLSGDLKIKYCDCINVRYAGKCDISVWESKKKKEAC